MKKPDTSAPRFLHHGEREGGPDNQCHVAHDRRWLLLILLTYLGLATLYAWVTPPFEKPDEPWHFAYSMYVAEEGRLPVQRLEERDHLAEQEGSQPPLYYVLHAAVLHLAGIDQPSVGYETVATPNPYAGVDERDWYANINQYVHGACDPDCSTTVRAVFLGRGLSIIFGLVALMAGWGVLRLIFPHRPRVALLATGLIAFTPQFLHIASSVSNDISTVAAVNSALLLLTMALWSERPALWVATGAASGLAVLGKMSGAIVALALGIVLVSWPLRIEGGRTRAVLLFLGGFFLVSGWWFAHNFVQYGEPTATRVHLQVYGTEAPPLTWERAVNEWEAVANSYWASFGWGGLNLSHPVYRMARWAALLLAIVGTFRILRRWRRAPPNEKLWGGVAVLVIFGTGALLTSWMRLTVAPLGRLLFPASLPIGWLLAEGLLALFPRTRRSSLSLVYLASWGAINIALLSLVIAPAYRPTASVDSLPESAVVTEARFGESVELLGVTVVPQEVAPGQRVAVTLYWRAMTPIDQSWAVSVKLFGRNEQLLDSHDSLPDKGRMPTTIWNDGRIVVDEHILRVPAAVDLPVLPQVEVDLYDPRTLHPLPIVVGDSPVRPFRPTSVVVRVPSLFSPSVSSATLAIDEITLDREGNELVARWVWRVGQPLQRDYRLFLHLTSENGNEILAQNDPPPQEGWLPTMVWRPGDRLPEAVRLQLPDAGEAGVYTLWMGLYDPADNSRFQWADGQDRVRLGLLERHDQQWRLVEP